MFARFDSKEMTGFIGKEVRGLSAREDGIFDTKVFGQPDVT